jgi:MFS transporter, BCD family, chlorophyll transporter
MQVEIQQDVALRTEAPPAAPPAEAEAPTSAFSNLSMARNIKIGAFHIGSSLADILASGVWNRVMIKELGMAATPIALLLSLRYFLAPLSIWFGRMSDVRPLFGYRRLPYVWFGRLLMVVSYVVLGLATLELAGNYDPNLRAFSFGLMDPSITENTSSVVGWLGVIGALVMFSLGSVISSTTFLSLIYDRTPQKQRTRAISVVWFFLIAGFAVAGILYSRVLPVYTREGFLSLFLIAPAIMAGVWFFSLVGEEKPAHLSRGHREETTRPFWQEMKAVWASQQTRLFFLFLALSNLFFYTQDVILEPFAAQVFNMPLATTNRFSGYWGSMTLVAIVISLFAARRYPKRVNNISLSRWGVIMLVITFALFVVCSVFQVRALVTINLITMGLGLGMWTVGSLGLMMDMTKVWGAGLYLALWTVASTLARGSGIAIGGVSLDAFYVVFPGQHIFAYGGVFLLQTVGFAFTLYLLGKIKPTQFAAETEAPTRERVFAATAD